MSILYNSFMKIVLFLYMEIDKPNNIIPKNTSAVTFKNDELIADNPPLSYLFIYLRDIIFFIFCI